MHLVVEDLLESRQGKPLDVVPFNYFNGQELARTLVLRKFHSKVLKQASTKS